MATIEENLHTKNWYTPSISVTSVTLHTIDICNIYTLHTIDICNIYTLHTIDICTSYTLHTIDICNTCDIYAQRIAYCILNALGIEFGESCSTLFSSPPDAFVFSTVVKKSSKCTLKSDNKDDQCILFLVSSGEINNGEKPKLSIESKQQKQQWPVDCPNLRSSCYCCWPLTKVHLEK